MIDPKTVTSPRDKIDGLVVLYQNEHWSLAKMIYDKEPRLGVRWNGSGDSKGNPVSRGYPTWFILPEELESVIMENKKELISVNEMKYVNTSKCPSCQTEFHVVYSEHPAYNENFSCQCPNPNCHQMLSVKHSAYTCMSENEIQKPKANASKVANAL